MEKMFEIVMTLMAEKDFERIWDYIAQTSDTAAVTFFQQVEAKIYTLESNPQRCPYIPENTFFKGNIYRHLIFKDYRIVFDIKESVVIIHRVFHGAKLLELAGLQTE